MDSTFALQATHPYTPLRYGHFTLTDWGGNMLVLPTTQQGVALCVELNSQGQAVAQITWHMGPNEQLAEPLRIMRDDEQHPEHNAGLVRY